MATDTAIATVDERNTDLVANFDHLVTHGEGGAIHNYSGSPQQMFIFTSKCTGSEVTPGGEHVGEVINLKYWYVFPVQFEAIDGELTSGLRTVLVDISGNAFGFGSTGIAASLLRAVQAYGPGPYVDGIALRLTQVPTRRGHRFFRLEPENMDLID